jgi:hypothetical protein
MLRRIAQSGIFITLIAAIILQAETYNIKAAKPTHYFYTPAPYVNEPFCFVASLHELSFSLPGRFQLQASLFDNIGRVNFGGKFQVANYIALGAGIAYNLLHMGNGSHGIWDRPRLGLYAAFGVIHSDNFEFTITPHTQIFPYYSMGCDFGVMAEVSDWVSVIGEVGTSYWIDGEQFYFNTDGGVRIHPPKIPFLSFDFGVDVEEFHVHRHPHNYDNHRHHVGVAPFLDVIFAIRTNH